MISLVAPAVFDHVKHESFTVCFDSIGGYHAKYSVITIPHANEATRIVSELLEQHDESTGIKGKLDFVLKGKAGEELELTRAFGDELKTVKTQYKANRDIEGRGVMHYQSYLKSNGVVFVCNL